MDEQPRWIKILGIVASILASVVVIIKIIYDIMRCWCKFRGEPRQEPGSAEQHRQSVTSGASVELPVQIQNQNQNPSTEQQPTAGPGPGEPSGTIFRGESGQEAESADHRPQGMQRVTSEAVVELEGARV